VSEPLRPFLLARSPVAFAHRGGARLFPENTLAAFEGAYAMGVRFIETDLWRTRDGHWVCHHDETLERCTDGSGRVSWHTRSELEKLDAGHRFSPDGESHPFRGKNVRVPALEEALAVAPDLYFVLEVKPDEPDRMRDLFEHLDRANVHSRVLVASGHDSVTTAFRRVCGGSIVTSAGHRGIYDFALSVRAGIHRFRTYAFDALQVPPSHTGRTVVDRAFVDAAHEHGIRVHVWTIDERAEMERLLALDVDGIMSDRPDVLLETVRGRA
jgi:glycerophosphoryl diester phosphodiesterase